MADFDERIRFLSDQVGTGHLVSGCDVNQPYAQDQHQNLRYKHRTGRSHFLGGPLLENSYSLVDRVARAAVTPEGSRIKDEARDIAEDIAGYVEVNAPVLTGDLRNSGSPYVLDNGIEIYRRLPRAPRDDTPESGWHRD